MRYTSINSEISELDRFSRELDLVVSSYRATFIDVAESAVVLQAPGASVDHPLHHRLRHLAVKVSEAPPAAFPDCSEELRDILGECRESASAYVQRLEQERVCIEQALHEFTSSVDKIGDGAEPIRVTVERLRSLAQSPEAKLMRTVLRAAADSVERGVEQMQKQHRMAAANLQSEIRALHRQIPNSASSPPSPNGALLDRATIETRLREMTPGRAWIALLRLRGYRMLCNQPNTEAADQLLAVFTARSRNTFPVNAALGRWSQDEFIAVFPPPGPSISPMAYCKGILDGLSDPYTCVVDGRTLRSAIEVKACVVDTNAKESAEQIMDKVATSLLRM